MPGDSEAKSAPPCPQPDISIEQWTSSTIPIDDRLSLRYSQPDSIVREGGSADRAIRKFTGQPYLVEKWSSPVDRFYFYALWIYDRPGFPSGVLAAADRSSRVDWATCTEPLGDGIISIASWCTETRDRPVVFSVAAHLRVCPDAYLQFLADTPSRPDQEIALRVVRTFRSLAHSES